MERETSVLLLLGFDLRLPRCGGQCGTQTALHDKAVVHRETKYVAEKVKAMKAYGGVEESIHVFFTSALVGGERPD
jgi:hypothetical protein